MNVRRHSTTSFCVMYMWYAIILSLYCIVAGLRFAPVLCGVIFSVWSTYLYGLSSPSSNIAPGFPQTAFFFVASSLKNNRSFACFCETDYYVFLLMFVFVALLLTQFFRCNSIRFRKSRLWIAFVDIFSRFVYKTCKWFLDRPTVSHT